MNLPNAGQIPGEPNDAQTLQHDASPTSLETPPAGQTSTLRKIFMGNDGLRAVWSLLIFAVLCAVMAVCLGRVAEKLFPNGPRTAQDVQDAMGSPRFLLIGESVQFLVVLFVTWIMSRIERRPNAVYGFGDSRKVAHFFAGLAWGVSCLSLLVLTLWKMGFLVIDGRQLFGGDILRYGAVWLIGFLMVGLFEEYITRGYLQYTLARGLAGFYERAFQSRHSAALGFWTSALVFSFLFGFGHKGNPGESSIGVISAGLVGFVLCLSLWRTGSLWWAIGFHASWDWGQNFLYGTADSGLKVQHSLLASHPVGRPILSGGTTGPEGSAFVLAILALMTVIVLITLPKRQYGRASRALEGSLPPG